MSKNREITNETKISITLVIALLIAVWQLAEWKGGIDQEIQRLETRIEQLEKLAVL